MKFIAGAAAAALAAAGLSFAASPAQADPYTPAVKTQCTVKVVKKGAKKVVVKANVKANGTKVKGVKKIKIKNAKGKVVKTIKLGKKAKKKAVKLPKGKYTVKLVFTKTVQFKKCSAKGKVRR